MNDEQIIAAMKELDNQGERQETLEQQKDDAILSALILLVRHAYTQTQKGVIDYTINSEYVDLLVSNLTDARFGGLRNR